MTGQHIPPPGDDDEPIPEPADADWSGAPDDDWSPLDEPQYIEPAPRPEDDADAPANDIARQHDLDSSDSDPQIDRILGGGTAADAVPQTIVDAAVAKRFRREADQVADALFAERLTPELYEQLVDATRRRIDAQLLLDLDTAIADAVELEEAAAAEPPKLVYANRYQFFTRYLAELYRREVTATAGITKKWCQWWFLHDEAVAVVDALWRSFEVLRLDPGTGWSVWKKDHADHHMNVLFDPEGTFKHCSVANARHTLLPPLPSASLPPELLGEDVPDSPLLAAPHTAPQVTE
jgi:hypothetical protein